MLVESKAKQAPEWGWGSRAVPEKVLYVDLGLLGKTCLAVNFLAYQEKKKKMLLRGFSDTEE